MEAVKTRWMAMVASIWIQASCGATYTFGIYSSILKSTQSYDQSTLDSVSVSKDLGANVGVLSGLLYAAVTSDHCRHRRNPWPVLVAGAIQCFAGYFFIWSAVVGLIAPPPVPLMWVFMFLAAHAQTFFNTTTVVTAVHNFSSYGGTAVGIMKGFLGLSGAILIQLYDTVFKGNPATFILILAITPTVVSLLLMPLVRIYETSATDDKEHLNGFSAVSLTIAVYLMVLIACENTIGLPRWAHIVTFTILTLLLASPLIIAGKAHHQERLSHYTPHGGTPLLGSFETSSSSKLLAPEDPAKSDHDVSAQRGGENMNLVEAMCCANFWLLFLAMICGMGSGLATINNIRQVGESLHYSAIAINSLISLCCIWNFFGRFGAGYVSDVYLHRKGWPRPLFMAITLAMMSLGHLIIALGFSGNLYLGSVVVGISYGSQWSLMPTITSELFGVRHMGTIFNTIGIASPIGSYIFSVRLIGYMYDTAAGGDNFCYGTHCFMTSFLIMAFVAFFGFLVACGLAYRTKNFYKHVVAKRLHHT